MWKPALVGAIALATTGTPLAVTSVQANDIERRQTQPAAYMSNAQIGRYKAALRLTSEQERHWPPVAAALRNVQLGSRMPAVAGNVMHLQRLVAAAKPLFRTLNNDQKLIAMRIVESLGFGAFVAAL